MSSITLYFCGTGHDRNTKLGAHGLQDTFHLTTSPCWIFDGPGSNTAIPGMRSVNDGRGTTLTTTNKEWQSKKGGLGGTVFGTGMSDNVTMAVEMLRTALKNNTRKAQMSTRVCLVGHSRGSITAMLVGHGIVNDPAATGNGAQLHLYLNDPVFGSSIPDGPEYNTIPGGAVSSWTIQMEDLSGRDNLLMGGSPRLQMDARNNRIVFPMPGGHGAAFEHQKNGVPQGVIGTALLQTFLVNRGVTLSAQLNLSDLEYCELYAQVKLGLISRSFFSGKLSVKSRASSRAAFVRNQFRKHTVFVNWHHVMLFEGICPSIFKYIEAQDNGHRTLPRVPSAERGKVLNSMPFTAKLFAENKLFDQSDLRTGASDGATTSHATLRGRVRNVFGFGG